MRGPLTGGPDKSLRRVLALFVSGRIPGGRARARSGTLPRGQCSSSRRDAPKTICYCVLFSLFSLYVMLFLFFSFETLLKLLRSLPISDASKRVVRILCRRRVDPRRPPSRMRRSADGLRRKGRVP